jgi:hypothetical protein
VSGTASLPVLIAKMNGLAYLPVMVFEQTSDECPEAVFLVVCDPSMNEL